MPKPVYLSDVVLALKVYIDSKIESEFARRGVGEDGHPPSALFIQASEKAWEDVEKLFGGAQYPHAPLIKRGKNNVQKTS